MDRRVATIIGRFERLAPADLDRLDQLYTPDARFKDPFNDVQGLPAIRGVFEHMFRVLENPRFVIVDSVTEGDQCFLTWDFLFGQKRMGPGGQRIHGGSHLKLAADGRIVLHRDYWDAAEELYEKIPVLGGAMRWLKKRAAS